MFYTYIYIYNLVAFMVALLLTYYRIRPKQCPEKCGALHTHCSEHTRLLQACPPGMADACRVKSLAVKLAEIEFSQDMLQLGI